MKLTENAITVLRRRYLLRDANGTILETPEQLFRRVALKVASAELSFNKNVSVEYWANEFYTSMCELNFLPNSPTLMNAGTHLNQLSACFVLPIDDTLDSIFTTLKHAMLIQQGGGGTGFNFSRLRPKGNYIERTGGESSGPVSFIKIFDAATGSIKQGGKRRGANMGILNIDHPDIEEFIHAKTNEKALTNFNISVGVTHAFMHAVENDLEWELKYSSSDKMIKTIRAKKLWDLIVSAAWTTGDPGLIFIDEINDKQPTPAIGTIDCTNPCGEVPLLPYEACNLGSVNLANMVVHGVNGNTVDWDKLERTIRIGIRFLDNVITVNEYIIPEVRNMVLSNRKIGLGVMGWSEMLIKLAIPYESQEAILLAEKLMCFVNEISFNESMELAKIRGPFPNWGNSIYNGGPVLRNATRTSIAPTGTISIIAGTSSSIEPLFALAFNRQNILRNESMVEVNELFLKALNKLGINKDKVLKELFKTGDAGEIHYLPMELRLLFKTSLHIHYLIHLRHQEAFQKFTDNAVSKTINLPHSATKEDVDVIFRQASRMKLKGVTIFRTGSKSRQVLNVGTNTTVVENECKICIE